MKVVQTDGAERIRRANLKSVGNDLRGYYGDLLKEAIPSRLTDLLQRLDESTKGYSEKQDLN
jgi:Anti-sigma factor NepR